MRRLYVGREEGILKIYKRKEGEKHIGKKRQFWRKSVWLEKRVHVEFDRKLICNTDLVLITELLSIML